MNIILFRKPPLLGPPLSCAKHLSRDTPEVYIYIYIFMYISHNNDNTDISNGAGI